MQKELSRFLRYLQVEKGYPQGTIKACQLDMGKGQSHFCMSGANLGWKRPQRMTSEPIWTISPWRRVTRVSPGHAS
jgi:hypothetical protein